ncbi:MAG: TraB/GumN family protein [Cyclobacteriaceae bacterium]
MKITLTLLSALTFLFSFINPAHAQKEKSLLWKISGKGLEKPSYLFGTIHLMCPQDIKITEAMQSAMSATEQLVLELDMDEPGIMQEMMSASMMKDGTTIKSLLSEEDYQLLENFMKDSLGMPLQSLAGMKPMLLSTVFMLPVLQCQPGSYEMSLVQAAKEHEMEVFGLETVADQIAVFDAIPLKEQSAYLVKSIKEYDQTKHEIKDMIRLYQTQDVDGLYKMINKSMAEMENAEDALLNDRNLKWLPQIEETAKEKPTFFAVGAGHLAGPQGVITLLRKAGYEVEAVKAEK